MVGRRAVGWVAAWALAVGDVTAARAAEVRGLRAEPAQPGVAQTFSWRFELKTKWHEASSCTLTLLVDGELPEAVERQPTLEITASDVTLRGASAWGRPNWRWPRNGSEIRLEWAFDSAGTHRLGFDPKRSGCDLDKPAELVVEVQPDYRAMNFVVLGVPEVSMTRKLDNSLAYLPRGSTTEVVVAREDIARWRRVFDRFQPGSWDDVQWAVLRDHLIKIGARNVRVREVDDWDAVVKDWDRDRTDRLLLVPGREFARLPELLAGGRFATLVNMDADHVARFYRNREVEQAAQAQKAETERQERTARVLAALPNAGDQITALRRVPLPDGKAPVCARRMPAPVGGDLTAYRKSDAFVAWSGRPAADGFDEVYQDLDAMYLAFKQGRCQLLVTTAGDAQAVARALARDQLGYELYELKDAESLLPFYAAHYGYASADDARVARRFSPMPDGKQAAALRAANVTTPEALEALWQRAQKQGYPGDRNLATAVAYLADEAQGKRAGQSAVEARRKREAAERATAAADKERLLKAYPYRLELSCRNGSYGTLPVAVCFSESNRTTLAELQNCVSYRTLGYEELARDPVIMGLCAKFVFKAQNASEFLLMAVLRDERTGQIIERHTAQRYQRIVIAR